MRGTWSVAAAVVALSSASIAGAGDAFGLRLLGSIRVADASEGFDEPSGLALDAEGMLLWSVSDDTRRVFAIGPDGRLDADLSFDVDVKELEDVVASGERLLLVKEDSNEVLAVEIGTGRILERKALSDMDGYDAVRSDFEEGPEGKGLEGITVDPATGTVYALKEGEPRLLLEIAPDLGSVVSHRRLTAEAGFVADGEADDELDVAGIAYDAGRDRFWIVSDVGRRVFLYDMAEDRAVGAGLLVRDGDELGLIKNAEGVALNAGGDILFVITDDEEDSVIASYEILPASP